MLPDLVIAEKSHPRYPARLRLDVTGRRHVIVWLGAAAGGAVDECLEAASDIDLGVVEVHGATGDDSEASLLAGVTELLDHARMGMRLYAVGPESFVWSVDRLAGARGFGKGEVVLVVAGSLARRVLCAHCKHTEEGVITNPHLCGQCGRMLEVRDHFSRRRGAFLGVMADAETPGDLPPPTVCFA